MKLLLAGTAIAVTLFASAAANAAPGEHHHMGGGGAPHGFGGGFSNFRDHDRGPPRGDFRGAPGNFRQPAREAWQHGSWRHDRHNGRLGWWFVVDDDWFFYPEPIYPYPAYSAYDAGAPYAGNVWYRCDNPRGYYPYVAQCFGPWQVVPAAPPPG